MTERTITAENTGPVTISVSLDHGGSVRVAAEAGCERATLKVATDDETGPAAEAVQDACMRQTEDGLKARVTFTENSGTTVIQRGGRSVNMISTGTNYGSVVQVAGNNYGSMTGMTTANGQVISGGDVTAVPASSPVDVVVTVPEGSTVVVETISARVSTRGNLASVETNTTSGRVNIDGAASVDCRSVSGRVAVDELRGSGRVSAISGRVEVHATSGGSLRVSTVSGRIDITAASEALAAGLCVSANSVSGRVNLPTD